MQSFSILESRAHPKVSKFNNVTVRIQYAAEIYACYIDICSACNVCAVCFTASRKRCPTNAWAALWVKFQKYTEEEVHNGTNTSSQIALATVAGITGVVPMTSFKCGMPSIHAKFLCRKQQRPRLFIRGFDATHHSNLKVVCCLTTVLWWHLQSLQAGITLN